MAVISIAPARRGGDIIAFDRESVRRVDDDGRLHVAKSNISKAAINGYRGDEIPDHEGLGLDPNRIYRLYRHPDELARAAATFNNVPVLSRHVPVSADDHRPDLVVGSTGTDAAFDGVYLTNSLVIWAKDSIRAIESGEQEELSSAYRYRADMTPGTVGGETYDGVMRDLVANHVALVKEGRAGPDVVVGDSKMEIFMTKNAFSPMAAYALGHLTAHLKPKLAQDATIDLVKPLDGITKKNFAARKPALLTSLKASLAGKLAADADIDDLTTLLDAIGEAPVVEVADAEPGEGEKPTIAASALDRIKQFLAGKLSDEDIAKLDDLVAASAQDEDGEAGKPKVELPKDVVTKSAMDSAISAAVKAATDRANQVQREIRDAERAVRPYVGDLAMAHDSAEAVYRTALKSLGVSVDDVHASALPTILSMQPKPGAKPRREPVAMDTAGVKTYAEMFPGAARIGRA